jgi:hypothetical protein
VSKEGVQNNLFIINSLRSFLCSLQRNEPKKRRPAAWPAALLAKHINTASSQTRARPIGPQTSDSFFQYSCASLGCAATGFKTLKAEPYNTLRISFRHPPIKGGETQVPITTGRKEWGRRVITPSPLVGEGRRDEGLVKSNTADGLCWAPC